jgi:hypothetical protein
MPCFNQREIELIFSCLNGVNATPATLYENVVGSEEYANALAKDKNFALLIDLTLHLLDDRECQDVIDAAATYWKTEKARRFEQESLYAYDDPNPFDIDDI